VAQLALDLAGVGAQDRVGGQEEPAAVHRAAGDRAHEAPHDLAEDERRLGRRGVDADAQARDVDALTDHVDGDEPAVRRAREGLELLGGPGLGVQDDGGRVAGGLAQHPRHGARVLAVGGDHQRARVAVAVRANLLEAFVGGGQDARQAVGELQRDRRAVAPARLARGDRVGEGRLDEVVAAAPLQHAVVGDEGDRAADPVADGVGVAVGDVGCRDAVVVAHARDRALVGAKGRAREQQPARRGPEGAREPLAPRELLAEVMGLVGDDERRAAALARPSVGDAGHARVGHRDAAEVARRAQLARVGHQVQPEPGRRLGPLARERRRGADDGDAAHDARLQQRPRVLERRPRLARARRRGDEERPLGP
jgi:hypothetical protein